MQADVKRLTRSLSRNPSIHQLPVSQSGSVSSTALSWSGSSFSTLASLVPVPPPSLCPVLAPNPLFLSHLCLPRSCLNLSSCLCLPVCTSSSSCLSSLSPPPNTDSITKHRRCGLRKKDLKTSFRE